MAERQLLHFDIEDRQAELRDSVAPDDFLLRRRQAALPFTGQALAYCADWQSERVLYSIHGAGLDGLFREPFLYAAQLRGAQGVVSVPFERLEALEAGLPPPCPTLIFSPGRTGSTLLARLLWAAGGACASEPDMLTQICRCGREDRLRMGLAQEQALLRAALVSLCRALGPDACIKLRSQCNARAVPLLAAAAGARPVFLVRRLAPWALSRHLAFGEPAVAVAAVLRQAIDALDALAGAGRGLQVLWFEALVADPLGTLQTLLPGKAIDAGAVAAVMAADAQDGTSIARQAVATATADAGFASDFAAAWAAARAGAEWSDGTLDLLAKMGEPRAAR